MESSAVGCGAVESSAVGCGAVGCGGAQDTAAQSSTVQHRTVRCGALQQRGKAREEACRQLSEPAIGKPVDGEYNV